MKSARNVVTDKKKLIQHEWQLQHMQHLNFIQKHYKKLSSLANALFCQQQASLNSLKERNFSGKDALS